MLVNNVQLTWPMMEKTLMPRVAVQSTFNEALLIILTGTGTLFWLHIGPTLVTDTVDLAATVFVSAQTV